MIRLKNLLYVVGLVGAVDAFLISNNRCPTAEGQRIADSEPTLLPLYVTTGPTNFGSGNDKAPSPGISNSYKDKLKRELLQLGASYDRGFAASPQARNHALLVMDELESLFAKENQGDDNGSTSLIHDIQGNWRLVWTTALDILALNANPMFAVGPIHQVYDEPFVSHIIDYLPRLQTVLPTVIPNTHFRTRITTKALPVAHIPNRMSLSFELLQLEPLQLLGRDFDLWPPLQFEVPRLLSGRSRNCKSKEESVDDTQHNQDHKEEADTTQHSSQQTNDDKDDNDKTGNQRLSGTFDVTYLDDDFLIVRQQSTPTTPGALAMIKVNALAP